MSSERKAYIGRLVGGKPAIVYATVRELPRVYVVIDVETMVNSGGNVFYIGSSLKKSDYNGVSTHYLMTDSAQVAIAWARDALSKKAGLLLEQIKRVMEMDAMFAAWGAIISYQPKPERKDDDEEVGV